MRGFAERSQRRSHYNSADNQCISVIFFHDTWPMFRCKLRQEGEGFVPITATYGWHTFDGTLQRIFFVLTMGLVAVGLNALLWVLSLPWVAWRLVCWVSYEVREVKVYWWLLAAFVTFHALGLVERRIASRFNLKPVLGPSCNSPRPQSIIG